MSVILDDRVEELVSMKAVGEQCLAKAREQQDEHGLAMWQRCVSQLETIIATVSRPH